MRNSDFARDSTKSWTINSLCRDFAAQLDDLITESSNVRAGRDLRKLLDQFTHFIDEEIKMKCFGTRIQFSGLQMPNSYFYMAWVGSCIKLPFPYVGSKRSSKV